MKVMLVCLAVLAAVSGAGKMERPPFSAEIQFQTDHIPDDIKEEDEPQKEQSFEEAMPKEEILKENPSKEKYSAKEPPKEESSKKEQLKKEMPQKSVKKEEIPPSEPEEIIPELEKTESIKNGPKRNAGCVKYGRRKKIRFLITVFGGSQGGIRIRPISDTAVETLFCRINGRSCSYREAGGWIIIFGAELSYGLNRIETVVSTACGRRAKIMTGTIHYLKMKQEYVILST